LNFASFLKLKLKGMIFKDSSMQDVEFAEADLTNVSFLNCDLHRANFEHTILEGADLRSAYNFSIDPEVNKIKKARFAQDNLSGLLHKYNLRID